MASPLSSTENSPAPWTASPACSKYPRRFLVSAAVRDLLADPPQTSEAAALEPAGRKKKKP